MNDSYFIATLASAIAAERLAEAIGLPLRNPMNRLDLSMENPINRRNLEGVVVKLVNGGAVAQAKLTRSGFNPFEGHLFCPLLVLKDGVFLSVIVNEFKFVYLASSSVFHSYSPLGII
jgi:hypothetical protein